MQIPGSRPFPSWPHPSSPRPWLAPTAVLLALAIGWASAPVASARVQTINANANLRTTYMHGSKIEARGTISGTFAGTLSVRVSLNSGSQMTASFSGSSHAGSLAGSVSAEYFPSGSVTRYEGSVRISSGSGSYAHARALGVHVEGVLNRARHLVTMQIRGRLSE